MGVGEWIGAFAEYLVATESMCHPIPARMPFEEAAMLEPFCVGLHAVRRADLRMGETVAILGVGTIGMMTLLAAHASGPGWTVVTDPSAAKRDLALRCGADVALDPTREDPVAAILKATGGRGVDVVFVAAAAPGVLEQAVNVCRRMGRLVIIASFFTGGGVEARLVQQREQTVLGHLDVHGGGLPAGDPAVGAGAPGSISVPGLGAHPAGAGAGGGGGPGRRTGCPTTSRRSSGSTNRREATATGTEIGTEEKTAAVTGTATAEETRAAGGRCRCRSRCREWRSHAYY